MNYLRCVELKSKDGKTEIEQFNEKLSELKYILKEIEYIEFKVDFDYEIVNKEVKRVIFDSIFLVYLRSGETFSDDFITKSLISKEDFENIIKGHNIAIGFMEDDRNIGELYYQFSISQFENLFKEIFGFIGDIIVKDDSILILERESSIDTEAIMNEINEIMALSETFTKEELVAKVSKIADIFGYL